MTRKVTILFTIIVFFACRIHAQQYGPQEPQKLEKMDYVQKAEKYRKMRSGGAVLTVVGSILVISGAVTMASSMDDYLYNDSETPAGVGLVIGGYVALGAGIPLWIVGGVQHKKYSTKLQELSIKINAAPQAHGLTLTYRF